MTSAAATAAIIGASVAGSLFLWNVSPSLPRGLYRIDPGGVLSRGSIVAFEPPSLVAAIIVERGYLPQDALLLKTVVAMPGDHVCMGEAFAVNGRLIGPVPTSDSSGRPLEPYRFCGAVPPGCAFAATPAPHSLDSRYFGPLPLHSMTPARPVWTF